MSITVLIADDHKMMREGLRLILERVPGIVVAGEAENGSRILELTARLAPDIVIMDISMKEMSGTDATREIKARHPGVHVIGLSVHSDEHHVLGMIEAGASGYVLKAAASEELVRAIEAVAKGKKYLSSEITSTVVDSYVQSSMPGIPALPSKLRPREREILRLLTQGKSSKEIAFRLKISPATVDTHRRNIMKKLDLHTIAELTKYAIREGLTSIDE